jgi:hypothetical protein
MSKKKIKSLAAKARKHFRHLDQGKEHYAAASALLQQIRQDLKPGQEIPLNAAGDKVVLEDLYAATDKVFRAHGIGRFELRVLKAAKAS